MLYLVSSLALVLRIRKQISISTFVPSRLVGIIITTEHSTPPMVEFFFMIGIGNQAIILPRHKCAAQVSEMRLILRLT